MASGFFVVLDDIALLLDDAAAMSQVAARKTAGLLGDDLAVNAEKATGFHASRELPVIWAITRGSLVNKLIILPLALLFGAYMPWLILPILLLGGCYLSYEGVEKVVEWFSGHEPESEPVRKNFSAEHEAKKIKSAIRTDFILSIEIIIITLGTVTGQPMSIQITVVTLIALAATVGVYGVVALLVRMDDVGLSMIARARNLKKGMVAGLMRLTGHWLVAALPKTIRLLSIVGTVAMLLVGGGMFIHNIDVLYRLASPVPTLLADLLMGLLVGVLLLLLGKIFRYIREK